MVVQDANMIAGGQTYLPPTDPVKWEKIGQDLAELDALCKSKYTRIVNDPSETNSKVKDLDKRHATWCEIAGNRTQLVKKGKIWIAQRESTRSLDEWIDKLKTEMGRGKVKVLQDGRIPDDVQILLFNRPEWEKREGVNIRNRFTSLGEQMPADIFSTVYATADELKAHIDRTASARAWEPPPYKDAAVESFIKTKFTGAPEFKGAKVMKIGLDYTTWKKRESLSLVGSDSKYKYYKVEHNFYKRGKALVKMPGQPFCQSREWVVGRGAKGIVLVSLGGSGIYMKCE